MTRWNLVPVTVCCTLATPLLGQHFTPVPVVGANVNLNDWDGQYPSKGTFTLGGVPFTIGAAPNAWWAENAVGANPRVLTLPVGVAGATAVDTLISTTWGRSTGGLPGPDGVYDNNDFVVFIDRFFAGC